MHPWENVRKVTAIKIFLKMCGVARATAGHHIAPPLAMTFTMQAHGTLRAITNDSRRWWNFKISMLS